MNGPINYPVITLLGIASIESRQQRRSQQSFISDQSVGDFLLSMFEI